MQAQFGLPSTLHDCYVLATRYIKTIRRHWSAVGDSGTIVHYAQNQRAIVLLQRFRSEGRKEGKGGHLVKRSRELFSMLQDKIKMQKIDGN